MESWGSGPHASPARLVAANPDSAGPVPTSTATTKSASIAMFAASCLAKLKQGGSAGI